MKSTTLLLSSLVLGMLSATGAHAASIKITITNNAPAGGVGITPLWVGFHDGSFDAFDEGASASAGLEAIAEDGNASVLSADFNTVAGRVDGLVGGGPIAPGASATQVFTISGDMSNLYLSYAAMVLPSSDYFIGNDDPTMHSLASVLAGDGPAVFNIGATGNVYDAGTEVNDFTTSAGNALVPGLPPMQGAPDTGADEMGLVHHVINPYDAFLNAPNNFDFSLLNFNDGNVYGQGIATVTVSAVPVPAAAWLFGSGLLGLVGVARRRKS